MAKFLLRELYKRNPDKYILKVMEELAELGQATAHFHDGKITENDLIDEIADVMIQLDKLQILVEPIKVIARYHEKLHRLANKITETRNAP